MTIIHKPTFSKQLKQIIEYIALDKPSASMKFKNELKEIEILRIFNKNQPSQ